MADQQLESPAAECLREAGLQVEPSGVAVRIEDMKQLLAMSRAPT